VFVLEVSVKLPIMRRIVLPADVCEKSQVFPVDQVTAYGRYVLLVYDVPKGREFEKSSVFRRRLLLGGATFSAFVVKARLEYEEAAGQLQVAREVEGIADDSDDSYIQESGNASTATADDGPPSSQRDWSSPDVAKSMRRGRKALFWLVMVRFDQDVQGTDRFFLAVEGPPVCVVKRDLNFIPELWLGTCQRWMCGVCIPESENGSPLRVVRRKSTMELTGLPFEAKGKVRGSTQGLKRSPFFGASRGPVRRRRVSPVEDEDYISSEEAAVRKVRERGRPSGMRQEMLEHRIAQLERRVRDLEELLVRIS
jgi:hypothetical protein